MGNSSHKGLSKEVIRQLKKESDFSEKEIKEWYEEYHQSKKGSYLTVKEFKDVYSKMYGADAGQFAEHVFRTFDTNRDGKVDFREFLIGLSVTSTDNIDQKLRWAFTMYDVDGDGTISRKEMLDMMASIYRMTPSIVKPPDVATPEMMATKLFGNIDKNGDGSITWQEFQMGAKADPLALNMLQLNPDPQ
ncbi:hippocalcin-like protein 1 [Mizuhopecten yessoensis]|uniref:Hippocalcin-like protein 1 n=1 Tax=Mizuhopecten yessoensis TaxID=6573 RepID=A0A210QCB4_MIZYE|nr:hippocalcin-like protein 1 [Mizuhopecten yessoensis]XP_021361854.1 hippocalcin-like protein 1 [Mizuhopecten yessoensis]OWF46379.1 Hippocalcin-like protein 1 [Mizuhopecten yessoensis]